MKLYPLICTLACILFATNISKAQSTGENIIAGLAKWHDNNPQEKVFVQTDRDQYAAGETIWFKSWCIVDNKPSFLSKIIYVTLNDAGGKVIDKKMYRMDQLATASGMFDLGAALKTGNYTLTAATLWMLNYPQFIFQKNITVYGLDYKQKLSAVTDNKNQFSFFPEGGDLVETVTSQLAFKAVNKQGLPIDFKGSIVASDGSKVADIQSQHDGMGAAEITPASGKTYTAKITFSNGQTGNYTLPLAKKEGIVLTVNNSSPSRIAVLVNRAEYNKNKYNKIIVVAQSNGMPVINAGFDIDAGESATSIPKKSLPPGLLQVTAFDSAGNPLAERMVFIEHHQVIAPAIKNEIINTNKRGRNVLSFRVDADASSLSILVTDGAIDTTFNKKENIASSFLMSNDIKGYIHNPGYYFADKNAETLQNLDLLLMTQGWRRFTWKQVKGEEEIVLKYPVETFMTIKGMVKKSDRNEPVKNGFVTLITKAEDSTTILTNAQLTDKGEFIVDSIAFRTKAKISYDGTDNKRAKLPVDVTIYPAYIDTLRQLQSSTLQNISSGAGNEIFEKYLVNRVDANQNGEGKLLDAVIVKTKVLSKIDSLQRQYVSPIYEMSDQSLTVDENKHFLNIWQFLNQNVPGFNVNPFQPGGVTYASFTRYDGLSLTDSEQGIRFFINEMQVDISVLDALNPEDVALVKIYKGAMAVALGAESGAISVYTKKGADVKNAPYSKTFSTMEKIGFAITREFYQPDYTKYPGMNAKENDVRIIFYWQPNAKSKSNGEYIVEFHNNDASKAFKVTVQGIDKNGQLIYKEQVIK